jgi:CPA1 family monovalent cation:H+ antiporter
VILVRISWVFISAYLPRAFSARLRAQHLNPAWQEPALISWVGIRGGISLAAALAIPTSLADGSPFPKRNEILILTFAVILATLVLQGLSLPQLLRWLNLAVDDAERDEEQRAGEAITSVALRYLSSASKGDEIHRSAVEQLQETYRKRAEQFEITRETCAHNAETRYMNQLTSLERELIRLQRNTLIDLRNRDAISDAVLRRFQVLLDLDEVRLEQD